jgi:hypothetical protein
VTRQCRLAGYVSILAIALSGCSLFGGGDVKYTDGSATVTFDSESPSRAEQMTLVDGSYRPVVDDSQSYGANASFQSAEGWTLRLARFAADGGNGDIFLFSPGYFDTSDGYGLSGQIGGECTAILTADPAMSFQGTAECAQMGGGPKPVSVSLTFRASP